jgi:hypothetical protein
VWLGTTRSNFGRPNRSKFVHVVVRNPQDGKPCVRPHFAERKLEDRRVDDRQKRRRPPAPRRALRTRRTAASECFRCFRRAKRRPFAPTGRTNPQRRLPAPNSTEAPPPARTPFKTSNLSAKSARPQEHLNIYGHQIHLLTSFRIWHFLLFTQTDPVQPSLF